MKWFPDWSNEIAVVIGSGPSVTVSDVNLMKSRARAIAINNSYRLAPWADALYATDVDWWILNLGARDFNGLKITSKAKVRRYYPDVEVINVPRPDDKRRPTMILEPKGLIGSGGNSGFQALNLAVQFGSKRIILLGFDMRVDYGTHWHGKHREGLRNPDSELIDKWRQALDKQAATLEAAGVHVVNASPISALTAFPRFTAKEALSLWT